MSDVQNGFIIKQMVDRLTVCDKYMQIKFKCGGDLRPEICKIEKNEQRLERFYTAFRGANCDFYCGYFFRKWWK